MKKLFLIPLHFIFDHMIAISLFALYLMLMHAFHLINCPIKWIIGYPCPGCGMSRAGFALLRLDFKGAWEYNPVIFVIPLLFLIIVYKEIPFVSKIYTNKYLWGIVLILCTISYILRWVYLYPKPPMDFNENNIFSTILHYLFKT